MRYAFVAMLLVGLAVCGFGQETSELSFPPNGDNVRA